MTVKKNKKSVKHGVSAKGKQSPGPKDNLPEQAVKALEESESRYRALFESSPDGILIAETQTRKFLYANPAICKMLGYSKAELEAMAVDDIHPKKDLPHVIAVFQAQARGDIAVATDISVLRKDGTVFYADINSASIVVDGKTRVMGFFRDVSERKRAEEELREGEEKYHAIFEHAADAIVLLDAQTGTLLEFNSKAHENLGYSREEFQKLKIADFEVIESAEEVIEHTTQVVREGSDTFATKHRTKDGRIRDILVTAKSITIGGRALCSAIWRDITEPKRVEEELQTAHQQLLANEQQLKANNQQLRATGQQLRAANQQLQANEQQLRAANQQLETEIVERKNTEKALQESEQLFRLMVETAFDGISICEIDPDMGNRRLLFCNDRYVEMSGYTREKLMKAKNLDALVQNYPSDELTDEDAAENWLSSGAISTGLGSWKRPDGKENIIEWSAVAIEKGDKFHVVSIDRDVTERQKTETALRESEQLFRLMVETAFDGINMCEIDPKTRKRRLIFCNDHYVAMSGYTREQLMNAEDLNDLVALHPSGPGTTIHGGWVDHGRPAKGQASWKRPDGKENFFEWSGISVKKGGMFHTIGVDRDITERQKTETALQESEERFRTMVETALDGIAICEYDPKTTKRRLIFCNDQFVEISGYTREQLTNADNLNDLVVQHISGGRTTTHGEWLATDVPATGLSSWKRPDGKENTYEWSAIAIKKGDKYHVTGVDRDITERIQAEKELLFKTTILEAQSETSIDGILVVDLAGKTILSNKRFGEMWGIPQQILDTKDDDAMIHYVLGRLEEPDKFAEKIKYLYTHENEKSRDEIKFKDGKIFDRYSSPLIDSRGAHNGRIWYFRDITKRRQAEEDLRIYQEQLEEMVRARTEELTRTNTQLVREIKRGKQLEEEILTISDREQQRVGRELHDSIGQQLTGIAFITKVLEQKLSAKSADEASRVTEISELVKEAIEQARHLARGLHPVDLDAGGLESSLQELAESTQKLFGIRCAFECETSDGLKNTDAAVHLYRITQEAITNAIKHGKTKNIQIDLACGKDESTLTVKNDGLDFPRKSQMKSKGIGLQIMNHRVNIIGGSLDIHKAKGGGTIVICKFSNKKR